MRWWRWSWYPWSLGQLFLTKRLTSEQSPTLFELELGNLTSVKLKHCWSQPSKLVGLETPVKATIPKMSEKCKNRAKAKYTKNKPVKKSLWWGEEPVARRRAYGEAKKFHRSSNPPLEGWTTAPLGGVNDNPARKCSEQQVELLNLNHYSSSCLFFFICVYFLCYFYSVVHLA